VSPSFVLVPALLLCASYASGQEPGVEERERAKWVLFTQEQGLYELVDACASMLGVAIEYDPAQLQGRVTMRMAEPMSDQALWTLANRALFSRDLTSVQTPGSRSLTIVPVSEAPTLARVEDVSLEQATAGFVKVLVPLRRERAEGITEAVQLVLSKAGTVTSFEDSNALIVADLRPNVEQAMRAVALLDATPAMEIAEFAPRHASPVSLSALIDRVRNAHKAVTKEELRGTLLSLPEEGTVLIVAPRNEIETLRSLLGRFDRAEPVSTLNYHPRRFGLAETASLIQRVVPGTARPMEASSMKMVSDEHKRIQDVFHRLEEADTGPSRPIRSFPVKNRGVEELRELLDGLLADGVLDPRVPETEGTPDTPEQGPTAPLTTDALSGADEPGEVVIATDPGTNRLIAMGEPRLLDQLGMLIEELDVKHTQVLVEAIAVSLTDDQMHDLGVELQKIGSHNDVAVQLASLFGLGSPDPAGSTIPAATGTGFAGVVLDPGSFSAAIRALETVNEGRTISIPKVLVNNNQTADLNSVQQSPYASVNASQTVATTSFGGTLDAGTQITVTPQIAEGDLLVLDYSISFSTFVGDSADPALPPPRQENSLHSVATVPDGYAVVVGGLEVESDAEAVSRVPVLGRIPLLGALFRNTSTTKTRSRFFVFIRANVLRSGFEELRYLSKADLDASRVEDGLPALEARIIR
jgi:type II secretory pathway component GspD/PulD (secretin)